jgi:hypothetical protein
MPCTARNLSVTKRYSEDAGGLPLWHLASTDDDAAFEGIACSNCFVFGIVCLH